MGNILTFLGWGTKAPSQNDPRNRNKERDRDPWPPAPARSYPTSDSYSGSQGYDSPSQTPVQKEVPPPPRLEPVVTPIVQNIPPVQPLLAAASSDSTINSEEPMLQSTCEIQLQSPLPTSSSEPVNIRNDDDDRKEMEKSSPPKPEQIETDSDEIKPEVEGAVVKIQAGIRGYLTRKALKERTKSKEGVSDVAQSIDFDQVELMEPLEEIEQNGEENAIDEAATLIQASFRGYKARQELKEKQSDAPQQSRCVPEPEQCVAKRSVLAVKEVVEYGSSSELESKSSASAIPAPVEPKPVPITPRPLTPVPTPTQALPKPPTVVPAPVPSPPVIVPDEEEYEEDEYTDEEEEEEAENDSDTINHLISDSSDVPPAPTVTPIVNSTGSPPNRTGADWVTSTVYQSGGDNHLGDEGLEDEYEEEEEEEEESEEENDVGANGIASSVPARVPGPTPATQHSTPAPRSPSQQSSGPTPRPPAH